jgi:vacuolar-type H+-ATPase subunit I/STV1
MIERILENIIGLAALGIFAVGLYEWYRREEKAKLDAEIMARSAAKRAEINAEIEALDGKAARVKEDYNKAKDNVYEIIKKRNTDGSK